MIGRQADTHTTAGDRREGGIKRSVGAAAADTGVSDGIGIAQRAALDWSGLLNPQGRECVWCDGRHGGTAAWTCLTQAGRLNSLTCTYGTKRSAVIVYSARPPAAPRTL